MEAQTKGIPLMIPRSANGLAYKSYASLQAWTGARLIGHGAVIDFQTDHSATGCGLFLGAPGGGPEVSDVQMHGVKVISSNATGRNSVYGLISIFNSSDVLLEDCWVGSSSPGSGGEGCGIFSLNSTDLRIVRPQLQNTLADGIHLSRATLRVVVDHPIVIGAQDDGVSVVSVKQDATGPIYGPCQYIEILQPVVRNSTVLGNGVALIGAQDCTVIGGNVDTVPDSGLVIGEANYGGLIKPARNTVIGLGIRNAASVSGCLRVGHATDTVLTGINATGGFGGVSVVGSTDTIISGSRISSVGTSQFGVYDDATSIRTLVTGSNLTGNTSGPYLFQGIRSIQSGNIT
ncbi:hypothetical protein [Arthrobacter sp. 92]|uniref:hypothetical protein n=1 Tax=Arthrobacter sp. 92 TaxID=3418175 RepID=UPI003CFE76E0